MKLTWVGGLALATIVPAFGEAHGHRIPPARLRSALADSATVNDNTRPAGVLDGDSLTLTLELRVATWRPDGANGVAIEVPAFAEPGQAARIPGPLIRVTAGTRVHMTVRNMLTERAVIRGLRDHDGGSDSIALQPREEEEVQFTAKTAGTHLYFARTTAAPTILSRVSDSQLVGALIVDSAGASPSATAARERVLVITAWDDSVRNARSPYGPRQLFAINGLSWPNTERLTYALGDTIRWRVINASQHSHPMHLHGFFFTVLSKGTHLSDTLYAPEERREAVTEFMPPASTMSIQWVAQRAGNWLYHCHMIAHVDEALRLEDRSASSATHAHVTDAMAGLVLAVTVRDSRAVRVADIHPPPKLRMRLFVTERTSPTGGRPSFAYVLQRGAREPTADSLRLPGSPLYLTQGTPTQITIVNRALEATSVHWHGMELESYFDGVPGWSGAQGRTAPLIAPGDSFVARFTPPRAGTFIYHTHVNDLAQLSGGLYGALIVLPKKDRTGWRERVIVFSDSTADSLIGVTPISMINGRSVPQPIELVAGTPHRLRLIGIGALTTRRVRLLADTVPVSWTIVAKDGADVPLLRRHSEPATLRIGGGETVDVLVTPERAGALTLEVRSVYNAPRVTNVPVTVRNQPTRAPASGTSPDLSPAPPR